MSTDPDDDRPRVHVTLPYDQGTITARLVRWVQRPAGQWDAVVHWYRWAATAPVGDTSGLRTEPMGELMTVPADAVAQIPGETYTHIKHVRETRAPGRTTPGTGTAPATLGERVDRTRRRSGGMS